MKLKLISTVKPSALLEFDDYDPHAHRRIKKERQEEYDPDYYDPGEDEQTNLQQVQNIINQWDNKWEKPTEDFNKMTDVEKLRIIGEITAPDLIDVYSCKWRMPYFIITSGAVGNDEPLIISNEHSSITYHGSLFSMYRGAVEAAKESGVDRPGVNETILRALGNSMYTCSGRAAKGVDLETNLPMRRKLKGTIKSMTAIYGSSLELDDLQSVAKKLISKGYLDRDGYISYRGVGYTINDLLGSANELQQGDRETIRRQELQQILHTGRDLEGRPVSPIVKKQIRKALGLPLGSKPSPWQTETDKISKSGQYDTRGNKYWGFESVNKPKSTI